MCMYSVKAIGFAILLILTDSVAFPALGIALGGYVNDPEAAASLGNAVALPMMFLSGVFWEIDLMPSYLRTLAEIMPLYHFHVGLRQLMVKGSTQGVLTSFAVLSTGAAISLILAIYTTDWKDF
ncbi:MAG: ABC transporter permease [Candidatus Nanohalobium sp.]